MKKYFLFAAIILLIGSAIYFLHIHADILNKKKQIQPVMTNVIIQANLACVSNSNVMIQWVIPQHPVVTIVQGKLQDVTTGVATPFSGKADKGYLVFNNINTQDKYYSALWLINGPPHTTTPIIAGSDCLLQDNLIPIGPLNDILSPQELAAVQNRDQGVPVRTSPSTKVFSLPTPTSHWNSQVMAWIYPGQPACNASDEIKDGRDIDVLKAEYYTITDTGGLVQLTTQNAGCNAYSKENAQNILYHSKEAYVTLSGNGNGLDIFLKNPQSQHSTIQTLISFTKSIGFSGVEIDFEGFAKWSPQEYQSYLSFVQNLGDMLHNQNLKLMLDGPPISDAATQAYYQWHYSDFNQLPVDYLVIMAYDYEFDYGGGSPVQPLSWLADVVTTAKSEISDTKKIVIGIPSYGYHAPKDDDFITIDTFDQSKSYPNFDHATRDAASQEMTFSANGEEYFYQDTISLDKKREFIESFGITHISVWHLGGNNWFSQTPE